MARNKTSLHTCGEALTSGAIRFGQPEEYAEAGK